MSFSEGPQVPEKQQRPLKPWLVKGGPWKWSCISVALPRSSVRPPNPCHPGFASVGYPAWLSMGTELLGPGPAKRSHPDKGSSSLGNI